jgi:hypothetical protein
MSRKIAGLLAVGLMVGVVGCHEDRPHEYGEQRPPVDQLDPGDRGLQSKDVVDASDQMAMDLLGNPDLNSSRTQWTIVVDHVDNQTSDPRANLDIFLQRLRTQLFKHGHGRVQLIENRAKLHELQSRERDTERDDRFGQGGTGASSAGARIQPDYSLYAVMMDLPNRQTDYYNCRFTLTDLRNGTIAWENEYEVKVAR